jgi:hypothetical protein
LFKRLEGCFASKSRYPRNIVALLAGPLLSQPSSEAMHRDSFLIGEHASRAPVSRGL